MSDDPFDDIDQSTDRDGDPFEDESLFTDAQAGEGDTEASEGDGGTDADPTDGQPAERRLEEDPFSEPSHTESEVDTSDPFIDFEPVPGEDPFDDFGVEGSDDDVWADLSNAADTEPVTEERDGRRVSDVSKHSFCEQCEYFTGPPRVACTNEGTDILEFLDMETVRVADCPVVAEREEIDNPHQ